MKRKRGQEEQNTSPKIENINTIFLPQLQYMAYSQSFIHHTTGLSGINIMTSSQLVFSSVGRALHQYRTGHGFKYRTKGLNFFQALFSLLLEQCSLQRRSLSYSRIYPQFKFVNFIYLQSFIHHFTDLFGTNIMFPAPGCQLSHLFTSLQVYIEST